MPARQTLNDIKEAVEPLIDEYDRIAEVEQTHGTVRVWVDYGDAEFGTAGVITDDGDTVRSPLYERIYANAGAVFSVGYNPDRDQFSVTAIPAADSRMQE